MHSMLKMLMCTKHRSMWLQKTHRLVENVTNADSSMSCRVFVCPVGPQVALSVFREIECDRHTQATILEWEWV